MEHLSDFVFISMGNITLARRDEYLSHLSTGIKPDTLNALRTAPLHINTLFPDSVIRKAEEGIAYFESKGHPSSACSKGQYHPYEQPDKRSDNRSEAKSEKPAWKNIGKNSSRRAKVVLQTTLPDQPRASSHINDNYCLNKVQARLLAGSQPTVTRKTINSHLMTLVNFPVVKVVSTAPGPSQKKE